MLRFGRCARRRLVALDAVTWRPLAIARRVGGDGHRAAAVFRQECTTQRWLTPPFHAAHERAQGMQCAVCTLLALRKFRGKMSRMSDDVGPAVE